MAFPGGTGAVTGNPLPWGFPGLGQRPGTDERCGEPGTAPDGPGCAERDLFRLLELKGDPNPAPSDEEPDGIIEECI